MIKALDGDSLWYAQDADGGIWKLDLSFSHTVRFMSYKASSILLALDSSFAKIKDNFCATLQRIFFSRQYDSLCYLSGLFEGFFSGFHCGFVYFLSAC